MKPLGDPKRHYWLAQRMAKTTETDLVGAYARQELSQEQWAGMVSSCRGCQWVEGCERWLAAHESSDDIPQQCPNCHKFADLKMAVGGE